MFAGICAGNHLFIVYFAQEGSSVMIVPKKKRHSVGNLADLLKC